MGNVQRSTGQPLLTEAADDLECVAEHDPDAMVCAIYHVQEALLRVCGQREP